MTRTSRFASLATTMRIARFGAGVGFAAALAACASTPAAPPTPAAPALSGLEIGDWKLTHDEIDRAAVQTSEWGEPLVRVVLSPEGAQRFAAFTAANAGQRVAIRYNGTVLSEPSVFSAVTWNDFFINGPDAATAAAIAASLDQPN
jgi:preprotein translocase subunit SecD